MQTFVRPRPVAPGSVIVPFASASVFATERVQAGLASLQGSPLGLCARPLPSAEAHFTYAGADAERSADLLAALQTRAPGLLWACRGGSGSGRLLADIDAGWQQAFSADPPWLVGFSDITALHVRAQAHGAMSLHAANLSNLTSWTKAAQQELLALLGPVPPTCRYQGELPSALRTGRGDAAPSQCLGPAPSRVVTGPLYGGNLTTLASLCGTGMLPSFAGGVLLLEDVGEAPYRFDRSLFQLMAAGHLRGVVGVALGQFTHWQGAAGANSAVAAPEAWLAATLAPLGLPIVAGLPIGHADDSRAVLLGGTATLDVAAQTMTVVP